MAYVPVDQGTERVVIASGGFPHLEMPFLHVSVFLRYVPGFFFFIVIMSFISGG